MDDRLLNLIFCIVTGTASSHITRSNIWDDKECVKFFCGLYLDELADKYGFYAEMEIE